MLTLTATPVRGVEPAVHGEGPVWDHARAELLWVDIPRGLVLRGRVDGDTVVEVATHRAGGTVGFVVPAADGGWLLGADGGFTHLSPGGTPTALVEVPGEGRATGTRMNDGAADPVGRCFGGTMAFDETPGAGSLHRVDLDGSVHPVLRDLTVSNGVDWSPDGSTVYLADSGAATVRAYDYDLGTGEFGDSRVVVDLTAEDGAPDGLTVDAEGCLWVAVWGGGQVRRYGPTGELLAVVEVPTPNTSSCAFAGPDLDLLVISTSTQGLTDPDPHAGRLFTVRPGVTGRPAAVYRGPLTGLRVS